MTMRCSRCDVAHDDTSRCPTDLEYERGYRAGFDRGSKESLQLLPDERRAVTELEKHLSAAECGNVALRAKLAAAEARESTLRGLLREACGSAYDQCLYVDKDWYKRAKAALERKP